MVVMVRDTTKDEVERDRVLSPGKASQNEAPWDNERTGETEGCSTRREGYSGTTLHYYVPETSQKDDSSYWTAVSKRVPEEEETNQEQEEVSLAMESSSHASSGEREKQLAKKEREAREVEDVIRRHTIRKFQEEMAGEPDRNGVAMRKKSDRSSMYVTPKKGKKKKKNRSKKKGFGIFGNLFSSQQASPEEQKMERLRPPILVVDDLADDQEKDEKKSDGNGCISPLMVTSPGLSCGGLLDEAFASAMRGAEDDYTDDKGQDDPPDVEDEDLYKALSPSSLLASPRVVRKFSNARRPLHVVQNTQPAEPPANVDSNKNRDVSQEAPNTIHVKAYQLHEILEKENEKDPMVPLHIHEQEMKKLRMMIENIEAQHMLRMQEVEDQRRKSDEGHITTALHKEEIDKIRAQNMEFIRALESEHASKVKELERMVESGSIQHSATDDLKQKCMALEEEKKTLSRQLEDATRIKHNISKGELETVKSRCNELEREKQGLQQEVEDLNRKSVALEHASAEARQQLMALHETNECLQRQVDDVQRQKSMIEETSLALANQVASLQSRLHTAEKLAQDAQQQLRIQDATMKTRISTMESLNSDIQRLTRDNTRLVGDKSAMEEHMRRLTSILHTVMARNVNVPNNDIMLQVPAPIENMSDIAIREMVPNTSDGKIVNQTEVLLMPNKTSDQQKQDMTKTEAKIARAQSIEAMTAEEAKVYKKKMKEELDKQLLQLNLEREKLELELSQMPQNSRGKTVAQRHRRKQVEYTLEELTKDIGSIKRELRALQR